MSNSISKEKKTKVQIVKYIIFNLLLLCCFFVFASFEVKADESTSSVLGSNHWGNVSTDATNKYSSSYVNSTTGRQYIVNGKIVDQYVMVSGTTQVAAGTENMPDVVVFTLTTDITSTINGIVVAESGFTSSSSDTPNYDSYRKDAYGNWDSESYASAGIKQGLVKDTCNFTVATAASNELKANNGSYYSLLCVQETASSVTIQYAYTLRSAGYGLKIINVSLYNDAVYDNEGNLIKEPILAETLSVPFVASKPINELSFSWMDSDDDVCGGTAANPVVDKICVKYVNGDKGTVAKEMEFFFPKEIAYLHDVLETVDKNAAGIINSIKSKTIYGINTFQNAGSSNNVRYYYWDFENPQNTTIDPTTDYKLTIMVDASGNYVFYIRDVFGNTFTTSGVTVNDVSKSQIIVDYTNAVDLTVMQASSGWTDDDWKKSWQFSIDDDYRIVFTKMKKGVIEIELHVFQKIVIGNGVYEGDGTGVEDIAKAPLPYNSSSSDSNKFDETGIKIWRVSDVAGDDGSNTNVSCETGATDANKHCYVESVGLSFENGTYEATGTLRNKVAYSVVNNGRYRIQITDNYGNSTNEPVDGEEKNPSVEVTVIDRTTPVISSGLTGAGNASASTSIETYAYVNGGGEKTNFVPGTFDAIASDSDYYSTLSYATAYYNAKGNKKFDYEDALKIAKIKAIDSVEYYDGTTLYKTFSADSYEVSFNKDGVAGKYLDPSSSYNTDRKTGTETNLHQYIVSNNITSFTAGLTDSYTISDGNYTLGNGTSVARDRMVSGTSFADMNYVYAKINSGTNTAFVNSTGDYLGYLRIKFDDGNGTVCTLNYGDEAANQACFVLVNRLIDASDDFSMTFTTVDYLGNESNSYVVNVEVIDTTSPGIGDPTDEDPVEADHRILYTNVNTICRLEIDNLIQIKEDLLKCYKIYEDSKYYIKDNNETYNTALDADTNGYTSFNSTVMNSTGGVPYVDSLGLTTYTAFDKIALYVSEDFDGNGEIAASEWHLITNSDIPKLKKSGDHIVKIEIRDHWGDLKSGGTDNLLTVFVNYYVNPRTLLIEPLANEKMYGEGDPVFDYCVYVNAHNNTFNLEQYFFESNFINSYFTDIYCSKDVFVKITDHEEYTKGETTGANYKYSSFTKVNSGSHANGNYIKVNNTYVEINADKRYTLSYEVDNGGDGDYLLYESTYYPTLSGYKYEDAACTKAYMGDGDAYLKISDTVCQKLTTSNTYNEKYTQADNGEYLKYNSDNDVDGNGKSNHLDALVKRTESTYDEFQGSLTRVESYCYNTYGDYRMYGDSSLGESERSGLLSCSDTQKSGSYFRNDNVGQYHIVLGTLSIKEGSGTSYNEDYVIKINTNYLAATRSVGNTTQVGDDDRDDAGKLIDHKIKAESTVNFTIRQAVLTITATGSSKTFGEMDPYSNVWNNVETPTNAAATGYLGGYTVHGWRNNDGISSNAFNNNYIINGILRREVGEEVGLYQICNINGNPSKVSTSLCTAAHGQPLNYNSDTPYYFSDYHKYTIGTVDGVKVIQTANTDGAALTIRNNETIYGNATGRTLNTKTSNYAIVFIKGDFTINAGDLIVQPGINQGKEFAKTEYKDPLWQLVVYGEATSVASGDVWSSDIVKNDSGFTGYTQDIAVESNAREATFNVDPYDGDTEIYYARRKTTPSEVTYTFADQVEIVDKYAKDANELYYKSSSGTYIYAYGEYHEITAANTVSSGGTQKLKITVVGRLVNQTYKLFGNGDGTGFSVTRAAGSDVGWYTYDEIYNYKGETGSETYTIKSVNNGKKCTITADSIEVISGTDGTACRNYNVVYKDIAPTTDFDAVNTSTIIGYTTTNVETKTVAYKPDGINACTDGNSYSKPCEDNASTTGNDETKQILFEIFKRKIILGFIEENYKFIYGERYDYYDSGTRTFTAGVASYGANAWNNNDDGIFHIDNTTSENNIFLCYSDLGDYLVTCSGNPDYGTTAGDTWTSIGLRFYLHDVVSKNDAYYGNDGSDKAVPAGKYYVYAEIGANGDTSVHNNYQFIYKGGTLTINPKVTSVELTSYTKEYGETKYSSYGTGSDYSAFTMYETDKMCMDDSSLLSGSTLITNCRSTDNVLGNSYGFTIEGLDAKDTIANNFTGRAKRTNQTGASDYAYELVGYYKIDVNNISSIKDLTVDISASTTTFKQCASNASDTSCVLVTDAKNAINYDISYSLTNNEGAFMFVLPATLDITVAPGQTKMYGCAYYRYVATDQTLNQTSYYNGYTYENGYVATNCNTTSGTNLDLAYQYTVTGDKANGVYTISTDTDGTRKIVSGSANIANIPLTDTRLYRVLYESDNAYAYTSDTMGKVDTTYQGQKVGVYTITLGNLNVATNANSHCDVYNNPVLEGGSPCKNYNINYYGNSSSINVTEHTYSDEKEIEADTLALYTLNYLEDTDGDYILVDGKFVDVTKLTKYDSTGNTGTTHAYINSYVAISSLTKYKKLATYEKLTNANMCVSGTGCYIYLDKDLNGTGEYVEVTSANIGSLMFTDASGTTASTDFANAYIKVSANKYVKLSTLTRFKLNTASFAEDASGNYVYINGEYVQLRSLIKYDETAPNSGLFVKDTDGNGTHIVIYKLVAKADLTKYSLQAEHITTNVTTYKNVSGDITKNVYVFVNGNYIPYNSLDIDANGKVKVNSAMVIPEGGSTPTLTRGEITDDVEFTIIARKVYVHAEFNIKPYGEADPVTYMTCAEIDAAYGRAVGTCESLYSGYPNYDDTDENAEKLNLGVSMYHAVQNSLAKAPWTEWTDNGENATQKGYNDIQFDVLTGTLERKRQTATGKEDIVGKYAFDFSQVTTGGRNGDNYLIVHVTNVTDPENNVDVNKDMEKVWVVDDSGSAKTLHSYMYTTCTFGSVNCASDAYGNGIALKTDASGYYKLGVNTDGELVSDPDETPAKYVSISLIDKYTSSTVNSANKVQFWHLGFYKDETNEDRAGELAVWWADRSVFVTPYDTFKTSNDSNGSKIEDPYFEDAREVYFEIIKRTIYLYAVDHEKIYGEADKYSDFLVAVCGNADGYIADNNGIRCKNEVNAFAYGLSEADEGKFLTTIGSYKYMKQDTIRSKDAITDYMFAGTASESNFGIYFRRDYGENAGYYTVTACATQNGITDCTDLSQEEQPTGPNVGDNYTIVEIAGTLTINPRQITVTPDANQGFEYGNYKENGSMPNITFTESHTDADGNVEDGLVGGKTYVTTNTGGNNNGRILVTNNKFTIDGTPSTTYLIDGLSVLKEVATGKYEYVSAISFDDTYNEKSFKIDSDTWYIIKEAQCLVNISGLNIVCIRDSQNESLPIGPNVGNDDGYGVRYTYVGFTQAQLDAIEVYNGETATYVSSVDHTYYNYNVYNDSYSNPLNYTTRTETTTEGSRSALNLTCGGNSNLRYSRDVCEYTINKGDLKIDSAVYGTTTFYVRIMKTNLFTSVDGTTFAPYTGNINDETDDTLRIYIKYGNGRYEEIIRTGADANRYSRQLDLNTSQTLWNLNVNKGEYVKVVVNDLLNYVLADVDETVKFNITAADLTITPVGKQYKIYGEADPEIRFTVETRYVVGETHFQQHTSNIIKVCKDASTCYDIDSTEYNKLRYTAKNGTQSASGSYILLPKGWEVVLNSYAYNEEDTTKKAANLDYGVNYDATKYGSATAVGQLLADIRHYDKYTSYKSSATKSTTDILIGNLYVTDNKQVVGTWDILNGTKVGKNNLGNINYTLGFTGSVKFTIIPRPVNVEIENITKMYGQATDKESCDEQYASECIVGDGILITDDNDGVSGIGINEDENKSLLINNYNILDKEVSNATINGISVVYMSAGTDVYEMMNMPRDNAIAVTTDDYVTVSAGYYTESGLIEKKNDTLNIKVVRESSNIARNGASCFVTAAGETHCEDVGEYFLKFDVRGSTGSIEDSPVEDAYYEKYWGYNPNYYVIIYNNFEASGWSANEVKAVAEGGQGYKSITANNALYYDSIIGQDSTDTDAYLTYQSGQYAANDSPTASATLKIRKRPIQIVVETIGEYNYTQADDGKYLKIGAAGEGQDEDSVYHLITDTNRYDLVGTSYVQKATGEYLCTYAATNTGTNCVKIEAENRYNRVASKTGDKFSIEQNMNVPTMPTISANKANHHTTYDMITWYEEPRQVRTTDTLYGNVAYCDVLFALDASLESLRSLGCNKNDGTSGNLKYYYGSINPNNPDNASTYLSTLDFGHYIITRDPNVLYIRNGEGIVDGSYESNNYTTTFVNGVLQIDKDETPPVVNIEKDFIIFEANADNDANGSNGNGNYSSENRGSVLAFLEKAALKNNYCAGLVATRTDGLPTACKNGETVIVFTYEEEARNVGTTAIDYDDIETLLEMFGISSYDPSVVRASQPVSNKDRYHARWYIVIQNDFDQRKVGDYTVFVYAQDDVGNISFASTTTLRIVDTTNPISGTVNLYDAKVKCTVGTDCNNEDNWVTVENVYLPIVTLTEENLNALGANKASITSIKYLYEGKDASGNHKFTQNNYFGTYYMIPQGSPAKAVKHNGWTNAHTGIWMTVLGGDDNSIKYLDTSKYSDRFGSFTYEDDEIKQFTKSASGEYLLLGTLIDLDNVTKYRQVKLKDSGRTEVANGIGGKYDEDASGSKIIYLPDVSGTYIRYKGEYINLSSIPANSSLKLFYTLSNDPNTYKRTTTVPVSAGEGISVKYYIYDGEFYQISDVKFKLDDGKYIRDDSSTYVDFNQWNNYYTRDRGYTWIEYDIGTLEAVQVLNQDGQRLVMTKAVDMGYTYTATTSSKDHTTEAYCLTSAQDATCAKWQYIRVETKTGIEDYKNKVEKYNISPWVEYNANGNSDMKYAYLDTVSPTITLDNPYIEVYEYGCSNISNCKNNHSEAFGTSSDGYLYNLDNMIKYGADGKTAENGGYVKIDNVLIKIADANKYTFDNTKSQYCIGGANCKFNPSSSGTYIYVGRIDEVNTTVNALITEKIAGRLVGTTNYVDPSDETIKKLQVDGAGSGAGKTVYEITMNTTAGANVTSENADKLQANTAYVQSGVGSGTSTSFDDSYSYSETRFGTVAEGTEEYIADKYTTIFVYASVKDGIAPVDGTTHYSAAGYYKYTITPNSSKFDVKSCYATASAIGIDSWCNSATTVGSFDTFKEAIDSIVRVYKGTTAAENAPNAINFNGHDITFTIDYRISDLAGNTSLYARKGIILTSFTRTIVGVDANGAQAASLAVEVGQNQSVLSVLGNFKIEASNGSALRADEEITQTIYYNGIAIAENQEYDINTLENLDTTVPGVYKIVYSISRREGSTYTKGNDVELTVTVKPEVATVGVANMASKQIIITAFVAVSIMLVAVYAVIVNKKRKLVK